MHNLPTFSCTFHLLYMTVDVHIISPVNVSLH